MPSRSFNRPQSLTFVRLSLVLAVLAWTVSPLPALAQHLAPDLEIWSDPQIHLPIPKGWHRLEATWVAERILIATPVPLNAEELTAGEELDVPAILHAKIDALDLVLQAMSLDEIANGLIEEISHRMNESGLEFDVLRKAETTVGGHKAVVVVTRQDETISYALLMRDQGHLYEITMAYELDHASQFEGLADPIFAGVEPKSTPEASIPMEEKTTLLAVLPVPSDWHERTVEGALPQVVISREETQSAGARYLTGVSLLKISEYRKAFNLSGSATPTDVYGAWLQSYIAGISSGPYRLLQAGEIALDAGVSLLIEASYQDVASGGFIQLFNLVTAVGDDFYIATFEAPVEEFYALRPAFLRSIAGLRWR